jgi:cytochrome P450
MANKCLSDIPEISLTEAELIGENVPLTLARHAQEHGAVLKSRTQIGPDTGREILFLLGPEANRFVMHTHREAFSHAQGWTTVFGDLIGRGLLNMDDPVHAEHRKMWNAAFSSSCLADYLPIMMEVIAQRTSTWEELGEVNLYEEARRMAFDIATRALIGVLPGPETERLRALFQTMLHGDDFKMQASGEYYHSAVKARDELTQVLRGIVANRLSRPNLGPPMDAMDWFLRASNERCAHLDNAQILGHVNNFLIGAHDTTAIMSSWVLYLLATLPQQRQRVEAELRAIVPHRTEELTIAHLRALTFVENFIQETGRLHPPVYSVPRGVAQNVEFSGYRLPTGSLIELAIGATHFLPTVFRDPEIFDPDRFARPREEAKRTPYALVTFGGGPRICIGMNFANLELKALIVHVLRHYILAPADGDGDERVSDKHTPMSLRVRVSPRPME